MTSSFYDLGREDAWQILIKTAEGETPPRTSILGGTLGATAGGLGGVLGAGMLGTGIAALATRGKLKPQGLNYKDVMRLNRWRSMQGKSSPIGTQLFGVKNPKLQSKWKALAESANTSNNIVGSMGLGGGALGAIAGGRAGYNRD
jgi:hypothetical protein